MASSSGSRGPAYLHATLAGITLGGAWLVPETAASVVLGWLSAFFFAACARKADRRLSFAALTSGLIALSVGFYWLYYTIQHFGGFPPLAAGAIFALFVLGSSLQLIIFALLYRIFPKSLEWLCLRTAAAWSIAEVVSPRIFPWHLGHTQLAFSPLAQLAELGGAALISLLMIWCCDALLRLIDCLAHPERRRWTAAGALLPLCAIVAALWFGTQRTAQVSEAIRTAPFAFKLGFVQANISLEEKHTRELVAQNFRQHLTLSQPLLEDHQLIVWPETALTDWVPDDITNAKNDYYLEALPTGSAFLIGGLSYASRTQMYNSAFAIYADGSVPLPYHKRILMPFGEYTPLGDLLPWLRRLNSTAGEFSRGVGPVVFEYALKNRDAGTQKVKISPLICYEDIEPSLSRDAVNQGAELLINITNDAWFGESVAPRQHHLIAAFRAIENRRFLVRATNTGLSATVDPLGKTISQIGQFKPGVGSALVTPLRLQTIYNEYDTALLWRAFLALAIIGRILERLFASKSTRGSL